MKEMKEFETIKSLVDFMVESAKSGNLTLSEAVLQGNYIEFMDDIPEKNMEFKFRDYDGGATAAFTVTEGNVAYTALLPPYTQWEIEGYIEGLERL